MTRRVVIADAGPRLERLAQSGYFLGQAVIDAVLREVGE